jgi:hypothetical protein
MRRAALLCAAVGLFAASAVAAPPAGGAVRGVVRNVTAGTVVARAPVQLVFIGTAGPEPVALARTDAAGRFGFAGLADGRYLVTVQHQGVSYATHAVVSGGPVEVTVQVYDVSTQVPLRMALLGVAVEVWRGYLRVSEVVHLQNPTIRTFLGDVVFPLPAGARYVTFGEGFHRPRADGGAITDRLIVRPGAHQVAYMYAVGGSGDVSLDRRLAIPADRLEIFVRAPGEARGPALQPLPSVTSEGQVYTRATARAVPRGDLRLTITGVPSARSWLAPVAAGTLAALLIVGLMLGIARMSPEA